MDWTRVRFDFPSVEYADALGAVTGNPRAIAVLAGHRDAHPSIWAVEDIANGAAYLYFSPGSDQWFGPGLPAWHYEPCAPPAAGMALMLGDARDWAHYGFR